MPFQPLKFGSEFLRERLTFCEKDKVIVAPRCYDTCDNAQRLVRKLWDNVEQQEEDFQGNEFLEHGSVSFSPPFIKNSTNPWKHSFQWQKR